MTDAQQREAARQFFYKWNGKGKEDEDARSYWIDILQNILGVENVTDRVEFEKKVVGGDGNTKRIDVYIPETHVLIEQKSLGIALDKPQAGHNGMTPYEQAKYYDNYLPFSERARWIITSNFEEIWIYDRNAVKPDPVKITLMELPEKYHMLDFLVNKEVKKVTDEMKISLQAGELVGQLYDAFLKQYKDPENEETLKSLNKLCVRIVFCLYAEDASVFGKKSMFHDYMQQFDAAHARKGLRDLFRVLNQKPEDRDPYLADDDPMLAAFPYVNGGLFDGDDIEIPPFTDEIMDLLLRKASDDFDWSEISPTIFGAVFESTLNPETRRSGGMHYTSIENIHKVIDPLFLDDLKAEFEEIKNISVLRTQEKKLHALQDKLASLSFLDPSAGSGNFLTESYLQLRKLENEILRILTHGQIMFGVVANPIKVSISQFYGIEINDFAVTVARTALWIAENQMLKETEDIVHMQLDFLPLKTAAHIREANALRIDWNDVVDKSKLSYIMGNPPFIGARLMDQGSVQKKEVQDTFGNIKDVQDLDYVTCWYKIAAQYIQGTGNLKTALSTKWESIKTSVTTAATNIKTSVSTTWNNMKSSVSTTMSNLKSSLDTTWSNIKTGISTAVGNVKTTVSTAFSNIWTHATTVWNNIKSAMTSPIETAKSTISGILDGIKGLFNFQWSLPSLKLPHFSWSWNDIGFGISLPSISVSWYKKAMDNPMILNDPTIFGAMGGKLLGAGEVGSEMVIGTNTLMETIRQAVAGLMSGDTNINYGGVTVNVYRGVFCIYKFYLPGIAGSNIMECSLE